MKSLKEYTKSAEHLAEKLKMQGQVQGQLDKELERVNHDCDACGDMGMVAANVEVGQPGFGKLGPCPAPGCQAGMAAYERSVGSILGKSGLPSKYVRDATLEGLLLEEGKSLLALTLRTMAEVGDDLMVSLRDVYEAGSWQWDDTRSERPKNSLFIFGDYGTGKTWAVAALLNYLTVTRRSHLGYYTRSSMMMEKITAEVTQDPKTVKPFLIKFPGILVIDDCQKGAVESGFTDTSVSDFQITTMQDLLRERLQNERPTWVITNLHPEGWASQWSNVCEVIFEDGHSIEVGGRILRSLR